MKNLFGSIVIAMILLITFRVLSDVPRQPIGYQYINSRMHPNELTITKIILDKCN